MKILIAAICIVFLIWIINLLLQKREKKTREMRIKKRLAEKKKQDEKNHVPSKR